MTEVIAADFLLNFTDNIPKYRFTNPDEKSKIFILSQAVWYDKLQEGYLTVETLQSYVTNGKELTGVIKDELLKMYALNAVAGNMDLHDRNILIVNNEKIYAIDFGLDFQDSNKSLLYGIFNYNGVIVKDENGKVLSEIVTQDELFETTKRAIEECTNKKEEIENRSKEVCNSLEVPEKDKEIIALIDKNIAFMNQKIEIY